MEKKTFKRIPVFDFSLGSKEKAFVNDCLETSFIGQGSYVKDFEKKFIKRVKRNGNKKFIFSYVYFQKRAWLF